MHTSVLLEMATEVFPDRLALGPRQGGLCFSDLGARARAGGAWLKTKGGDAVVFIGVNGTALPLALFGAATAGKPFAPINYRLSDADLRKLLARTAPSVAIVDEDMLARVDGVEGVTLVPRGAFEAACADPTNHAGEGETPEDGIAVLLFTSGTTGDPKVAVLRHHHLTSYVISSVEFMGSDEEEAALISVPPYHIAGISAILTGIYGGRRLVYLPAFTPEAWVDAATAENVTHAMVVPTMLGRVLDILEKRGTNLPNLRALSYGGGPMPHPVIERALKMLPHVDFVNAYGLTETARPSPSSAPRTTASPSRPTTPPSAGA